MYKIGEFSSLAKTTIKTLRFYEKKGILKPAFVDYNGYRYYESKQLLDIARIISLRQMGISINEIKSILNGVNISSILNKRKQSIENEISNYTNQLSKINYFLEEKRMKYEVFLKELPECIVYYKEGIIKNYDEMANFILSSAEECIKNNPSIRCIEPDYCFMNYLDMEFKEKDIKVRYAQAVDKEGVSSENIRFKKLEKVNAVCIYHKGEYSLLGQAYGFIMKYIEDNKYEIIDCPRERYIDGIWNKDNPSDYLTEIQVPIKI